ncbi:MAG TPA: porin, partial [Pseudolabrys sp.]
EFVYGEGATDYVGSGLPAVQTVTSGTFPGITNSSVGVANDATAVGVTATDPGSLDLTKGWSFTGGYEHFWNPQWKTSLYGAYGKLEYSDEASTVLGGTTGANWSYYQIGSRTTWTPVQNLDLSLEVMYNNMSTSFSNLGFVDRDWVSGIFRVQRNFYP